MEKKCFKCGETKCLSDFYVHSGMADGHLNKCKECTKADSTRNRTDNIERIRAYDRSRGNRQPMDYTKEYRDRFQKKYKAHTLVNNSVRSGKLFKQPCEICGEKKTTAHHDDYAKPLNVRWLCYPHHAQWHAKNGEGANAT